MYADLSVHEFEQIKKHLGNPKVIFEAGCGIGRGSVYLNHLLTDDSVEYILADRTGWQWEGGPNFDPTNEDFYNDLDLTADFCLIDSLGNIVTNSQKTINEKFDYRRTVEDEHQKYLDWVQETLKLELKIKYTKTNSHF
jgi:hypothetical protein